MKEDMRTRSVGGSIVREEGGRNWRSPVEEVRDETVVVAPKSYLDRHYCEVTA